MPFENTYCYGVRKNLDLIFFLAKEHFKILYNDNYPAVICDNIFPVINTLYFNMNPKICREHQIR